jgi:KDO2-lipid IV(A) lauroyltransferase
MNFLIGLLLRAGFGFLRLLGPRFGPALGAFLARNLGPITPAHRIGRDNIAAAFPEKSAAERAAILTEAWDNLGRTACEYVHMDRIWDFDPENPGRDGHIEAA